MAPPPSFLVLLSLILSVYSLPQLQHGSHVARFFSRSLPVVEDTLFMGTLPVIPALKSSLSGKRDEVPYRALPNHGHPVRRGSPTADDSSGALTLPVIHAELPRLYKRNVEVELQNRSDIGYYARVCIGTPAQCVLLQMDTGSFEMWVNPNCTSLPQGDKRFCQQVGKYIPAKSRTADVKEGETKSLKYGIGAANITYVVDNVSFLNSSTMGQVRFGVADSSKDQFSGILGLGFGKGLNTGYKNLVDQLADQGVTSTKMFSVGLGTKEQKEGSIVLGGVDTSKFAQELAPLPIIPAADSPDRVARYWVTLNSISHTNPANTTTSLNETAMSVFLDTGATLTLLPPTVVEGMAAALGAIGTNSNGFHLVDCGLTKKNGTVNFAFSGVDIRVPYKEIIRELQTKGRPPECYLGVMKSNTFALLGDTFLRSAYAVFDLDDNMIYMAPYVNCGSTQKTIRSSSDLKGLRGNCISPEATTRGAAKAGAKGAAEKGGPSNGNAAEQGGSGNAAGQGGSGNAAGSLVLDKRWLRAAVGVTTCAFTLGIL